ncbi:hypothetical protein DSO57_1001129 [Entomophthora muscae]|uniref:Uncharacterized protein n=1 Tax=Entomophthora muscae TaxID=34485 RepID=A0ACC2S013_9FUNG|nr:hypothetical protein DSO57_1001129 [Entomophthora muscae]
MRKNEFLMISFRKDETIAEFANLFYLKAQILTGSGSLTVHDAHIALRTVVKPYEALYQTFMPAFQDNCTLDGMVHYLRQCGDTFGTPNTGSKPRPVSNYPGRLEAPANNNKSPPKPDITKVVCHRCNQKGHYASSCNSKTGIHALPPLGIQSTGKSQCGVEEELLRPCNPQTFHLTYSLRLIPDSQGMRFIRFLLMMCIWYRPVPRFRPFKKPLRKCPSLTLASY